MLHLSSAVSERHKQLSNAISGTRSYRTCSIFNNMGLIRNWRHQKMIGSDRITSTFPFPLSWGFFPLVCMLLVDSTLCWQQMFHSGLSAKGFNGRSKKWCLFWPPADGPHVLRTVSLRRQPVAVPIQSLPPGILCDHKTQKPKLLW